MKKLGFYFVITLIFSGCFNLKTPLPEVSYYDLDFDLKHQECQSSFYVGIAEMRALAIYETTDIVLRQKDQKILKLDGMAWIDTPKNLFKKFIVKQLDANCIKASLPPFGGVKNDYLLKMELLNFEVIGDEEESVQVGIFYEISDLRDFKVLKSGVIVKKEKNQSSYVMAFKNAINEVGLEIIEKLKR